MRLLYPAYSLLAGALLAASLPTQAHAQATPDSATASRWLVKAGLSLTHLRYSHTATNWQLQMPATLGLERRLGARYSLYGQLDTDWQVGSATARRRRSPGGSLTSALPAANVAVGGRFYYGQPASAAPQSARPELGRYLALQAEASFERPVPAGRSAYAGRGATLTPALYALWGVQNRWRPHLLADLNAGVGVLAPAHVTGGEASLLRHGWDVGLQANIRLYWAR